MLAMGVKAALKLFAISKGTCSPCKGQISFHKGAQVNKCIAHSVEEKLCIRFTLLPDRPEFQKMSDYGGNFL